MDIKNNEATDLRPDGVRLIDAPLIDINIPKFIKQIKSETTWQTGDRNAITVFKTNGMCIVLIALHANAIMKEHTAEDIISVQLLEGEVNFSTNKEFKVLKPGDMIALHARLPHTVKAIKESVFLLTLANS